MIEEIDDIILDKIIQGNEIACRKAIDRYQDFVFNLAFRIVGNREDAEEVAQDSFIKAFKHLESFNRQAKFSTWLYRITFNNAVTRLRKRKVISSPITEFEDYKLPVGKFDEAVSELEARDRELFVGKAINMLSREDQTLITLYYIHENSMEEISQITGLKSNNIKIKVHRARKKLYNHLSVLLKQEKRNLL